MTPLTAVAARRSPCLVRNRRRMSCLRDLDVLHRRRCRRRGGAIAGGLSGGSFPRGPPRALANRASLSRGRRTRGLACLLLPEQLQLSLRDGPVHTPMPTILVLQLEMLPAQIPASLLWRAPALPASSVRPGTSHALSGVNRVRREATPFVPRERRPRAWLDSSRSRVRGRNARGPASVVVHVARAAQSRRGQPALLAPAQWLLQLPRSAGVPVASARIPATRPTPLARWLAPRRLLPGGRTRRRRRRGRGAGGSAAAAASAPRRPRGPRSPRRAPDFIGPRARRTHIRKHVGPALSLLRRSKFSP